MHGALCLPGRTWRPSWGFPSLSVIRHAGEWQRRDPIPECDPLPTAHDGPLRGAGDQPRSARRPAVSAFASASSLDRNTELAPMLAGLVISVIAAVFIVLTTCASGSACCSCPATLELG